MQPILASWTIHDVLRRYPQLLDVLLETSPAFRHLRNPLMRRVQARLATVAHAARVAGMEPAVLVRRLNEAAGLVPPAHEAAAGPGAGPTAPVDEGAPIAADLDVRPILARGEEPFGEITAAAGRVGPGQAMRLRAPFEPVPLYGVLAKRGFSHRTRQLAPDDWEVLFVRTSSAGSMTEAERSLPPPVDADEAWTNATAAITIDVSDLVPPEPMVRILETLATLPPGATLVVHHVRRPIHLYPRLDELGCRHQTREVAPGRVEILIRKPDTPDQP